MTRRIRVALASVGALVVGLIGPTAGALGSSASPGSHVPLSAGLLVQGPRDVFLPATRKANPGPQQLTYHGGLNGRGVQHHPKVYLVFWGSQWDKKDPYADYEQRFFRGLYGRGDTWTGLQREWCDHVAKQAVTCGPRSPRIGRPIGGLVKGVWFDDSVFALPTDNPFVGGLTPDAVAQEAVRAAEHFGNTTPASNVDAQYIISEPSHFNSVGYGLFCAYHSYVSSNYGPVPYTDLPYLTDLGFDCGQNSVNSGDAGTYDGLSIVAGHEFIETISDPYVLTGWADAEGEENADKCAWRTTGAGAMTNVRLTTGTFAVQGTWSNLAKNGDGDCRVHV
jgi:serine protease